MSSPNVSWDVQDQNDRIISILAWVVVVVLVLYACVYFYKQARNVAERPPLSTDARLAQTGTIGTPPPTLPLVATSQSATSQSSPAPELALAGGDATRVVSHRPVIHPSPEETAPIAPPAPFGANAAAVPPAPIPDLPPSSAGYAVRYGKSFATPKAAQDALFQLPVSVSDVDFVQDGETWVLQLGKFKNLDEAKALLRKLQPYAPTAEIAALSATPAPAPSHKKPAPRAAARATKPGATTPGATTPGAEASAAAEEAAEPPAPAHPAAKPKVARPTAARIAPKPAAPRGLADKRGKTRPEAAPEDTESNDTEAPASANSEEAAVSGADDVRTLARQPKSKKPAASEEAGERGVVGSMATGGAPEAASAASPDADTAAEPRRKPAPARRRPAPAPGDAQPFSADADASGEVDASPAGAARRPTPRSRKTSAGTGTQTPGESASEEEQVAAPRPASPAGVQQQLVSAARDSDAGSHRYSLQVGAYASEDKARTVASQMRASGLAARVDEAVTGDTTMYRVRLGSFGDTQEAQAARRRIAGEMGLADVRVIKE